jgi:nitrogen regulatory protein PII
MRHVKRIEIVIGKPHEPKVQAALRRLGVPGLTVLDVAEGWGDRGDREGGELSDAMVNRYLLTTCEVERVDELAATLEPILRRYGGLVLISDAQLIRNA